MSTTTAKTTEGAWTPVPVVDQEEAETRVRITLRGKSPLLMHNSTLVDPVDPITLEYKRLTSKKPRKLVDEEQIRRIEWRAGLYWNEELGPHLPARVLHAALIEPARKFKMGAAIERALVVEQFEVALQYDGPRDLDGLWEAGYLDVSSVVLNGRTRTPRCRPKFREWEVEFTALVDAAEVNVDDVQAALKRGGKLTGIGDWRPAYGRYAFTLEVQA